MTNKALLKVLRIIAILFILLMITWGFAYPGDSNSRRYDNNRTATGRESKAMRYMRNQEPIHIPAIKPKRRGKKTYRKCYDIETMERVSCPKKEKTNERVRHN